MLLVEQLRETVAQRCVVHLPAEALFELVVVGELEDGRRSDLDLVAERQEVLADG